MTTATTSATSLFVKVARDVFLVGSGILVLLVFGDKIVQVRLGFRELHLVHTLTSVPMKEGLATEHDAELIGDTLPGFLDGGGVTDKDGGHLETLGRNVTDGCLEVVGDPFDKVRRVFVDHLVHLFVNDLGGDLSSEHHGAGEVTSVTRIGGAHHVLGIKGLLGEFGHRQDTESLRAVGGQRSESNGEKVETRERNMLTASFRRSQLSCPGNRSEHVVPVMALAIKLLRSANVGLASLRVRKQMS